MRVVGYVRVSTEAQGADGASLAAQRARLAAYADATELDLVLVYEDTASARTTDRPGLEAALALLGRGEAEGILVAKLDRLTRSVGDLGALIDRLGARALLSVGDAIDTRSAAGRLVLHVLTSVAQWEREAGAERTREALAHVRTVRRLGGVPLGERRVGTDADGRRVLGPDPAGLATLARIRELRTSGATLRQVAATLQSEGRRTARGRLVWSLATLSAATRTRGAP